MNFRILTKLENDEISEGMIIDYSVSPLFGIPLRWQTKITKVDYLKSFADSQKKGPYKSWYHFHEFISNREGVLMKDTVDYELYFGVFGKWLQRLIVSRRLEYIFDYREKVLSKKFSHSNREK